MRTTRRSRKLGLTTQTWDEHVGEKADDPEFWQLFVERTDPVSHVRLLMDVAREIAVRVLRQSNLPSDGIEALALNPNNLSADAGLAVQILSTLNGVEARNAGAVRDRALTFIAGFDLASSERQLLTNLAYEKQLVAYGNMTASLLNKPKKTKAEILSALEKFGTQKAAADSLEMSSRQIQNRISAGERQNIRTKKTKKNRKSARVRRP